MKKAAKKKKTCDQKKKKTCDIYGEPKKHPPVGKEYQAEIPSLMSKSEYLDSQKQHPPWCSNEMKELVSSRQNKGSSETTMCMYSEKSRDNIRRSKRHHQLSTKALEAIAYQNNEEQNINKLKRKRYPQRSKRS